MISINKIIWVLVLCAGLAFLVYAQNENQDWVAEAPDTSLAISAIEIDTVTVETDSSVVNRTDEGNLLSNLIKPVLLIGIVGGILILLYTQRGS
jgi:hypothetical protein